MAHRILVVDDDPHIRDVISFALEKAGMTIETARDGGEALTLFQHHPPDMIILDVGMPDTDGLAVCREIRKSSNVPILFLSARDDEIDRIVGLEIGGDDYVTKPFSPREIVARVNIILRRAAAIAAAHDETPLSHGALTLRPLQHAAEFHGHPLDLTAIEFAILKAFLCRGNIVFSRDQIMTAAYGANINVSDRTIDSHVRNIRAKLARVGCDNVIETVHAVGFRLGPCTVDA
ncbi:MAG TPA: response regulator transcription factor [Xanthobacteraceae bacterium]|nr:response regulator transcription factor [Xanthobacteraceae bacterium]